MLFCSTLQTLLMGVPLRQRNYNTNHMENASKVLMRCSPTWQDFYTERAHLYIRKAVMRCSPAWLSSEVLACSFLPLLWLCLLFSCSSLALLLLFLLFLLALLQAASSSSLLPLQPPSLPPSLQHVYRLAYAQDGLLACVREPTAFHLALKARHRNCLQRAATACNR